jgi:hypothetical protein
MRGLTFTRGLGLMRWASAHLQTRSGPHGLAILGVSAVVVFVSSVVGPAAIAQGIAAGSVPATRVPGRGVVYSAQFACGIQGNPVNSGQTVLGIYRTTVDIHNRQAAGVDVGVRATLAGVLSSSIFAREIPPSGGIQLTCADFQDLVSLLNPGFYFQGIVEIQSVREIDVRIIHTVVSVGEITT